ncbi:transcription factor Jun-like [Tubulanus polymorphus]|uniref:transcription factor Jun-like n=1 Tax=Tubulanus polymorphus TaxID=672921 RepID=UPI003DA38B29
MPVLSLLTGRRRYHPQEQSDPVSAASSNSKPQQQQPTTSKMETTMYGDDVQSQNSVRQLKRTMTLDFNSGMSAIKSKKAKLANTPGLLGSPDLNMLKLASPELERMIIQQNGMITTTPTPTQFLCPKFVTEEQEAYARGFVDALEELHKTHEGGDSIDNLTTLSQQQVSSSSFDATAAGFAQPQTTYTTLNTVASLPSMQQSFVDTVPIATTTVTNSMTNAAQNPLIMRIKEEPQTVPSLCNSPPLSPVDMENQEVMKVERKRARNRIAARKCRHRKLERISRLEDKVNDLKDENENLSTTATSLREQVCRLKQQILEHVKSGCQVMMSQNLTF